MAYALKDGGVANTGDEIPASELFGGFGLATTSGSVTDSISPPFYDIEISFADPLDFFAVTVLDAEESFAVQVFLGASLVQAADARTLLGTRAIDLSPVRSIAPRWGASAARCSSTESC